MCEPIFIAFHSKYSKETHITKTIAYDLLIFLIVRCILLLCNVQCITMLFVLFTYLNWRDLNYKAIFFLRILTMCTSFFVFIIIFFFIYFCPIILHFVTGIIMYTDYHIYLSFVQRFFHISVEWMGVCPSDKCLPEHTNKYTQLSNDTHEKVRYGVRKPYKWRQYLSVNEQCLLYLYGSPTAYRLWYRTFSWELLEMFRLTTSYYSRRDVWLWFTRNRSMCVSAYSNYVFFYFFSLAFSTSTFCSKSNVLQFHRCL